MPNEIVAFAKERPQPPSEEAYRAFCTALSETARGRAFLAEYTRRNRNADTEVLLEALARLEAKVANPAATLADQLRHELRALLETIRSARPQIDARPLPARAAKLAGLLDLLERRIEEMAEATPQVGDAAPVESSPESARTLAIVPPSDEPELPIPSPAGAQPPSIALVNGSEPAGAEAGPTWEPLFEDARTPTGSVASMPPVNVFDNAPPKVEGVEPAAARPAAAVSLPPADPLAAIMALSEEERIALFT